MATQKERKEMKEVITVLEKLGYEAMYGGGARSKGHGFWIRDQYRKVDWKEEPSSWYDMDEAREFVAEKQSQLMKEEKMNVIFGIYQSGDCGGLTEDHMPETIDALKAEIDYQIEAALSIQSPNPDEGTLFQESDLKITSLEKAWEDLQNLIKSTQDLQGDGYSPGDLIESTVLIAFFDGEYIGFGAQVGEY